MPQRFALEDVRALTYKPRDAWWTVVLVDPIASRLVQVAARYPWITPNRLTVLAMILGAGAVASFAQQDYPWLVLGAVLFHLSFVVDCMDGKIARLVGNGSVFGAWLDFVFDRLRVAACAFALFGGQYLRTGELIYLWLCSVVIFLDMFRYLNAQQMGRVRGMMRVKLAEAHGDEGARATFVEDLLREHPVGAVDDDLLADADRTVIDVNGDFRRRFGFFVRFRNFLIRKRIRAHLVSGIEFEMAVFIIAPITAVVPVTIAAGGLLLAFEALLVFKLWMATRTFGRQMAGQASIPAQRAASPGTAARAAGPADGATADASLAP